MLEGRKREEASFSEAERNNVGANVHSLYMYMVLKSEEKGICEIKRLHKV